jgi:hypothetical protein
MTDSTPVITPENQPVIDALKAYLHTGNEASIHKLPEILLLTQEVLDSLIPWIRYQGQYGFFSQDNLDRMTDEATASNGYIAILHYYGVQGNHWLMGSSRPFLPGQHCDGTRDAEAWYLVGRFLDYALNNPDRFPLLPKTRNEAARFYHEAYEDDDRDSACAFGDRVMSHQILVDLGYEESLLVQYDPDWPKAQIEGLLCSLYDMNHRSVSQWIYDHISDRYPNMATSFGMLGERTTARSLVI